MHFFADADTHTIMAMDVEPPVLVRRKIVTLDIEMAKITFEDEKKNRTLDLAPNAKVYIAGQTEKLERIKGVAIASIGLSPDRTRVEAFFLTKFDLKKAK